MGTIASAKGLGRADFDKKWQLAFRGEDGGGKITLDILPLGD
jgi:hypothetical protein